MSVGNKEAKSLSEVQAKELNPTDSASLPELRAKIWGEQDSGPAKLGEGSQSSHLAAKPARLPRLGFLGVGWIGRHRLEAVAKAAAGKVVGIADPDPEAAAQAREMLEAHGKDEGNRDKGDASSCELVGSLKELLSMDLDGLVIATPSAQHASQCIQALEAGVAVFCQKPLGRSAAEVRPVIEAAQKANRLIRLDYSYRYTKGMRRIRQLVQQGSLGEVFAADLVFHNAYGPDKAWFYNPQLAGGGCLMDLGIHLLDLALWTLPPTGISEASGRLLSGGKPLSDPFTQVEDYADAQLRLSSGALLRLSCSWKLQAGCDARIEASFYGTQGGATFRNLSGSFYDFEAEHHTGTQSHSLCQPPDDWGKGAILDWARTLSQNPGFEAESSKLLEVAEALDAIRRDARDSAS